jgi:hypothetical protein
MLAINNVQLNDEDEYSVKAKNKGGSRMSRAYLTVKCPPKINLPERYNFHQDAFKINFFLLFGSFYKLKNLFLQLKILGIRQL